MTIKRWTACVSNDDTWWFEPRDGEMPEQDSQMVLGADLDAVVAKVKRLEAALREIGRAQVNCSHPPGEYRDGILLALEYCARLAHEALTPAKTEQSHG